MVLHIHSSCPKLLAIQLLGVLLLLFTIDTLSKTDGSNDDGGDGLLDLQVIEATTGVKNHQYQSQVSDLACPFP